MGKENKPSHFFLMYKRLFLCIITNKVFIIIFCFVEFFDIFTYLMSLVPNYYHFHNSVELTDELVANFLLNISPYNKFSDIIMDENWNAKKLPNIIVICIYVLIWFSFYLTLYFIRDFDYQKESILHKIKSIFLINFYSYFFLRLIGIYGIHCVMCLIISIIFQNKYTVIDIIYLFLLILLAIGDTFSKYTFFTQFSVLLKFKFHECEINKYPFDTFFNEKYDKLFIFIKMIICLENNYFMHNQGNINVFLLFIDTIIIFCIFSLGIYLIYLFFINRHSLIYLSINEITLYRIIFINQNCFCLIIFFLFYGEQNYIIFSCFSVIYFVVQVIISVKNFEDYITSQAILSKNILGVCWFFQTNNIDHGTFITAWVVNHKINCDRENCDICKELNTNDNEENFARLDNSPSKSNLKITRIKTNFVHEEEKKHQEEKKQLIESYNINSIMKAYPPFSFICKLLSIAYKERHIYSIEDILRLDFMYLTVLFLSQNNQQFRFYRKVFILSIKYKNQERIVSMLRTITELVKNSKRELIKKYEDFKESEDFKNDLIKYVNDFENFLYFEIKTPESYLNISNKFDIIKKHSIIDSISKKTNENDYKIILLRFIYETIINSKIKNGSEFDINYYNDFLEFHFKHDRLLILNYSIERRLFTIIRGSQELLQFSGKDLEIIFPEFFKLYGINICLDKLRNADITDAKNNVELICKNLSLNEHLGYISPIKMEYSVYPTIKVEELLIHINYRTDYTNIIIFRTNVNNAEHLFSLSSKLFKFFGVTPEILSILDKSGYYIDFSHLFHFQNYNYNSSKTICIFNQIDYAKYYKQLMKAEGLQDCSNYKELKEFHKEFFQNVREEITFQIQKKFIIEDYQTLYIIYHIKEQKKKKKGTNVQSDEIYQTIISEYDAEKEAKKVNENLEESINEKTSNLNKGNGQKKMVKTLNIANPTLSIFSQASMTGLSKKDKNNIHFKNFSVNKIEDKKKRYKQIQNFTFSILIYGFFLVALTIIFLITVFKENNIFKSLFQLFQSFKRFQREIEKAPLMILSNFCYYKENSECVNYYEYYSDYMKKMHINLQNITLINKVIQMDLPTRYQIAVESFQTFEKEIFKIKAQRIEKIKTFKIEKFKLFIFQKNIYVERSILQFIDLIREFNNWISLVVHNDDYLNETFALLNFGKNEKYEYIITSDNNTDITQIRKNMYLILLNYPVIHNGLEITCSIIQEDFQLALKMLKGYLLGFFLGLSFLHIILLIICHFLLMFFLNMLKIIILPMNHQLTEVEYIKFIENRFLKIKELCYLYQSNPNQLINNIITREEKYKRNNKKKNLKLKDKEEEESEINNLEKKFDNSINSPQLKNKDFIILILSERLSIFILFSVYLIYSIIFFIFIDKGKSRLSNLVEYSNINQKLDSHTYDNFNTLIYIMLTNSTKYSLGERILNKNNFDYLFNGFDNLHNIIRQKETLEFIHKKSFPPMNTLIDLNCSKGKIPDFIFKESLEKNGENFDSFIQNLCQAFPVASIGDDTMLIKNILYLLNQIYNKYYPGSFDEIHSQINNTYLFDQFTIVLVVNSLIRYYFNENIFKKEVDNEFSYFSNLIVPYLVLNMILEIIIFWILNLFVISKIKFMHKKIIEFVTSLRM